ncbi:MAG: hypothetical protein BGO59_22765 [Spirosoma sp. 48-14]|nr:MAG: hypothetical protein BGO59_22765 [Spirosoma sp. 48-14]
MPIDAVLALLPPGDGPGMDGPTTSDPYTVSRYGLAAAGGAAITELIFPPGGCTFTETSEPGQEGAGTAWSLELSATIPKNQPMLLHWIYLNQGKRWLALWLDRNGLAYVAGEPGNGLRMGTARAINAENSVSLKLTGRCWHPAWFLERYNTSELFADVDFDLSFDFSFNA